MEVTLTKVYRFSVSFSKGDRVLGRNYELAVTLPAPVEKDENEFDALMHKLVIARLHTRDLSDHSAFKNCAEERDLLSSLWETIRDGVSAYRVRSLELRRDTRSVFKLIP